MARWTTSELNKITEIINTHLGELKLGFDIPKLICENIVPTRSSFVNIADNDPFRFIFEKLFRDRYLDHGQFHHFKSFDRAFEIINLQKIQISNLAANDENDFAEFSEFYKRLGLFKGLLPLDYGLPTEKHFDPGAKTQADEARENTFILCLTQDNHNEQFWKVYGKADTGVCLGFRLSKFTDEKYWPCNFRDVFYESGYDLEFINQINFELKKRLGTNLHFQDLEKFAPFYKRSKYKWENETRLSLMFPHKNFEGNEELNSIFTISEDPCSGRKYIDFPISSERKTGLFSLSIDEVVCGYKTADHDYQNLMRILMENYPNAKIWRRPEEFQPF